MEISWRAGDVNPQSLTPVFSKAKKKRGINIPRSLGF